MNLALIILTYNRHAEINRLLESIRVQDTLPQKIVIVDAGKIPDNNIAGRYPKLNISYIHAPGTSITQARNTGIAAVKNAFEFICFLDDDIVFHPCAISKMMKYWEKAPKDLGGAVFNVVSDNPPSGLVFLKRIFSTGKKERGIVLRSGWNTLICPAGETRYVQWVFGGATVWRNKIFDEFSFDEWYQGYGYVEDLDFGFRVGRKYKLSVVADAKVDHLHFKWKRTFSAKDGKNSILAMYHFICKDSYFSKKLFYWAVFGTMLENFMRGIVSFKKDYYALALGNFIAMINLLFKSKRAERMS